MGKILSSTYVDSVEKVTGFYNKLVDNPFYTLNDKKPIMVTYYNIDKNFSSLDQGSKLAYDNIGDDSPIRYNKIKNFIIYGFTRIELNTSNDEFGLEADDITGDCYILPGTITPTENDYFEVDHIRGEEKQLFIVTDVQKDTLENGSNAYKISYKLEYNSNKDIQSRVLTNNILVDYKEGTNITRIVRCEDYDIAKLMDDKAVMLKKYYIDLFYSPNVQTFLFEPLTQYKVYDSHMIEFLINNKILDDGEEDYIYIDQKLNLSKTFSIEYEKSFFRYIEKRKYKDLISSQRELILVPITTHGSIFKGRYETFYEGKYVTDVVNFPQFYVSCIEDDLIYRIQDKQLYDINNEEERRDIWKNIIIKHFHSIDLNTDELDALDNIDLKYSTELFYLIPIIIYCLEEAIKKVLRQH